MHNKSRYLKYSITILSVIYFIICALIFISITLKASLVFTAYDLKLDVGKSFSLEEYKKNPNIIKNQILEYLGDEYILYSGGIGHALIYTTIKQQSENIKNQGILYIKLDENIIDKEMLEKLISDDRIIKSFNVGIFTNHASNNIQNTGIFSSLIGSLLSMIVCCVISIPISITAAVLMCNIMIHNIRMKNFIRTLTGVILSSPPILFGIIFQWLLIHYLHLPAGSPIVIGITISMISIPIIFKNTYESLNAVPSHITNGSLALGATKIDTMINIMMPYAFSEILTGIFIGIMRAICEVAPLLLLGVFMYTPSPQYGLLEQSVTLPAQIVLWMNQPGYGFINMAYFGALVLIILLTAVKIILIIMDKKYKIQKNHD